jgi:hypothetical protein
MKDLYLQWAALMTAAVAVWGLAAYGVVSLI